MVEMGWNWEETHGKPVESNNLIIMSHPLAQLQHQIQTQCKQRHECICNFSFHLIRGRDLGSEAKGRKHLVTKQEGETI